MLLYYSNVYLANCIFHILIFSLSCVCHLKIYVNTYKLNPMVKQQIVGLLYEPIYFRKKDRKVPFRVGLVYSHVITKLIYSSSS